MRENRLNDAKVKNKEKIKRNERKIHKIKKKRYSSDEKNSGSSSCFEAEECSIEERATGKRSSLQGKRHFECIHL